MTSGGPLYMPQWLTWLGWSLGAIALHGVSSGALDGWFVTHGGAVVDRLRVEVPAIAGIVLIACAAALTSPLAVFEPPGAALVSIAVVAGLLAVSSISRPFGHALLAGLVLGALGGSLVIGLRAAGVPGVRDAVLPSFLAMFVTGLVPGLIAGLGADPVPGDLRALPASAGRMWEVARARTTKAWLPLFGPAAFAALVGIVAFAVMRSNSGVAASLSGQAWPGIALGIALAPAALLIVLAVLRAWVGLWVVPVASALAKELAIARAVAGFTGRLARPILVLTRFPRAICDHCLRWSAPLPARYEAGRRYCERCGGEVSYGGPGRLVALVGDQRVPAGLPPRVFARTAEELIAAASPVDVTHIRLTERDAMPQRLHRITAFLLSERPADGLGRIAVYPVDGRDGLPAPNVNFVEDHYRWAESDPTA